MNVADLPDSSAGCRSGYFGGDGLYLVADYFSVCTGSGYTNVETQHMTGEIIYAVDRKTTSGPDGYIWFRESVDNPPYLVSVPGRVVLGETYTADLRFEAAGVVHWNAPLCWSDLSLYRHFCGVLPDHLQQHHCRRRQRVLILERGSRARGNNKAKTVNVLAFTFWRKGAQSKS